MAFITAPKIAETITIASIGPQTSQSSNNELPMTPINKTANPNKIGKARANNIAFIYPMIFLFIVSANHRKR